MNVCLDKLNIVAKVDNAEVTMNDKFMPNSTHLLPMINTNKVTLVAMVDTNNSKILSSESKIEALIITEMTLKAGWGTWNIILKFIKFPMRNMWRTLWTTSKARPYSG